MSLTGALSNAFSGLKANARAAGLVSTNISNATTEGYGRRLLGLTPGAQGTHGGVRITGVIRAVDPVIIADRQLSDAQLGYSADMYTYTSRIEGLVGATGEPGALTELANQFENALLTAAANPASAQRLEMVATRANDFANSLNVLSGQLQDARLAADRTIDNQVTTMNEVLVRLDEINGDVVRANVTNSDVSTLLDEQQRLLDSIASIVPLRVVQREKGDIAVFSTNGAILLDGNPREIGFDRTYAVGAGDTLANGVLSGLTLDGLPASAAGNGAFSGGSLAAQFAIRDETAVQQQAELDGIARDLIERLGPGGPDSTLGVGDPGLFTDSGVAFDPLNEEGIAGRISLNNLVAPGGGGTWRLRDGLGAVAQGEVGDASLLQAVSAALNEATVPSSATLAPVARGFINHVADFSSSASGMRVRAENDQYFLSSQNTALRELEFNKGVDTDQELQRLMQIEQLYTANAKVMTTVDELLERLMAI